MSLFGKKEKCIFYLKHNALRVFTADKHYVGEILFDDTTVKNQEIVNKKQLTSKVIHFFESHQISPSTAIVILEKSLVFEGVVPADKYKSEQIEEFKQNLPFPPDALRVAVLQIEDQVVQLAVNGAYVNVVIETLRGLKHNIDAVIPEHILSSLVSGSFLSKEYNQKVFDSLKQIKEYDLFSGIGDSSDKITSLEKS